jgi:hypothetical protein
MSCVAPCEISSSDFTTEVATWTRAILHDAESTVSSAKIYGQTERFRSDRICCAEFAARIVEEITSHDNVPHNKANGIVRQT